MPVGCRLVARLNFRRNESGWLDTPEAGKVRGKIRTNSIPRIPRTSRDASRSGARLASWTIAADVAALVRPPLVRRSLQWWPTLAGVALAAFIALGTSSGRELASILAASGFVYLGAAALQKPSAAWPLFFGTFVVIAVNRTGLSALDATWIFLLIAVLLAAYGLARGAVLPTNGLPLQTIAMAGFGAIAAAALNTSGDAAAYLVAAGLLGHAAWDVYHYLTNRVVVRSMAEFCAVLDTLLAMAIVAATASR
jgi:hypothetical protein